MRRHGSVSDILIIAAIMVGISLGLVFGQTALDEFDAANTKIDQQYFNAAHDALGVFDKGVVFVGAAMYMLSIILAFRIPSSPIFFIPSFLLLSLSLWVSAEFSNVFHKVINVGGPVTDAANQLPLVVTFFDNFVFIQAGIGFLLMIVMFTRIGNTARGVGR